MQNKRSWRLAVHKTIAQTVSDHLCHSCGSCVYVCPRSAVTMQENEGGLLLPAVNENKCSGCGLCAKVCPGDHLDVPAFRSDPFRGEVIAAYCGQAADKEILRSGQSGGLATALLYHLLDTIVDKALVTEMPPDGSLRPICHFTHDKAVIARSQGSKYCPVPLNSFLPTPSLWKNTGYALVGLPCHLHGVQNILAMRRDLQPPVFIGLICDRTLSYAAIDYLIEKTPLAKHSVSTLHYRDKVLGGWPGNVSVISTVNKSFAVESKHRMWCKRVFTPPRCSLCFDKMNVFADVVLGDAWGVRSGKDGYSVILARTNRGFDIVENAVKAGVIHVDRIEPESVFMGQHIEEKRRDWTAFITTWRNLGRRVPDFAFEAKWETVCTNICAKPYVKSLRKRDSLAGGVSRKRLLRDARTMYYLHRCKERALRVLKLK